MSCSPFDLRDYLLGELAPPDRRQVEKHVGACSGCREELDRLQLTQAALLSVPDEEIPQRIGFVSDKVFAPSPWRRMLGTFWSSSPRLVFVSVAIFSCALVVTTLYRPVPAPAGAAPVSQVDLVRLEADFNRRLHEAVQKAVAESEGRQAQNTAELLQAVEKQYDFDRRALLVTFDQNLEVMQKQRNRAIIAANDLAAARGGESQ
jgi:anti-sigma factor RsiW